MKKISSLIFMPCLLLLVQPVAQGQSEIADLFKVKCGICHTIGGGKLIGPDLAKVRDRHSEDWLLTYIRSSQSMINSGDPKAVALFEEYNKVIMPDPMISDTEITSLLDYITENSGGGVGTVAEAQSIIEDATPEDHENGEKPFRWASQIC